MNQEIAIKYFFESSDPSAMVIKTICDKKYGKAWYDWDPVTITLELKDDFSAELSDVAINRLSAVQVIMTTAEFFQKLGSFMGIANTLASGTPSFAVFDPVTVPEAAWAIEEVGLMREPIPFSYAIKKYMKTILEADGLLLDPPEIIKQVFFEETPEEEGLSMNEAHEMFKESLHDMNRDGVDAYVHDKVVDIITEFQSLGLEAELRKIYRQEKLEQIQTLNF